MSYVTKPDATGSPVGQTAAPAEGVELNAASLAAIQRLIEASMTKVIQKFEAKCEQLEKKISILESESMDRELEMKNFESSYNCKQKLTKSCKSE